MSALAESLADLEQVLRSVGTAVVSHLRPGLDVATTIRLLDQVGLVPSDEVVEWFSWHDGAGDPDTTLQNSELAPGVYIFSLEMLCQEYLDTRRDFDYVTSDLPEPWSDSSDLWNPSWFPLARLDAGYVAADLSGAPTSTSPVLAVWFNAGPYNAQPQWPTVKAFVEALTRRYERGTYSVNREGRV